ncbi:response regulator [Gloeobacter kilaueensis]|uniref:Two-component response regulator n=1 Tax=Gloeobacter kilaueensis (strain ATCC BAA-2537 / CCAP 1431/1 / ULC 316 / JS1) TaxID=1183438 RepID=U5QJT7_GLOK1|nr:response regulator transcription factor [Gloeobacter kilaueensis]AGY59191.1 two-component response regulator [Gloeobacter kilaueensis JS1]
MSPIRVVLIEDHDLTRAGMRMTLQQHQDVELVGEAANGTDGLRVVHAQNPDVAIVDIGLPDIDGIEVTRRLKSDDPDVRVLILTLRDNDQVVLAAFAAGADSYCMKDIGSADLLTALQTTREGNSWIDPSIARTVLTQVRGQPGGEVGSTVQIEAAGPELTQILEASPLTERELEVLQHIVEGHSNQDIADELFITVGTVKTHVRNILSKLCADDRTQAAVTALRTGLVR